MAFPDKLSAVFTMSATMLQAKGAITYVWCTSTALLMVPMMMMTTVMAATPIATPVVVIVLV